MAATQLAFTLRTSTNVKTAHLVGSWDNYAGQLPLSKDASKAGAWKATFRFSAATLKPGQRYWYYVRSFDRFDHLRVLTVNVVHHGRLPRLP